MSRAGVTLHEAREAYEKIKARGQYPSAQRLKDEIGSGSMTTLNAHLQILRAEDESKRSLEDLEKVSPDLVKTVMKLHGQLQAVATSEVEKAHQQFEQQRKLAEEAQAELQAKLEASLAQVGRLEQDLAVARSMYDAEREALVASREQAAALTQQVEGQAELISDLKSRLQVAQDEARRAVAQRDHYQAAVAEERNRERVEHASALSHQKAQNDSLSKELVARIEQQSQANIRIAALELEVTATKTANAEIKAAQARLIEQLDSREATIGTLRQNLDLSVAQERDLREAVTRTTAELAEAKQAIAIAEVKLSHAQTENSNLNEKVKTAEAQLEEFRKSKGNQVS